MKRLGWGDFAEIAGSIVVGYFLDDPSIPIDVAISKLAPQLADLQNRLEKLSDSIGEIEDFLNNLVPALRGVIDLDLTKQSMGKALGAYQDIQDIMSKPSTFANTDVQARLTRRLDAMHDEIMGTIGLLGGGMSSLYATASTFACYAKAYMAQQRLLDSKNRLLIWDTTFHRYYMDMIYRLTDAASIVSAGYDEQAKSIPCWATSTIPHFDALRQRWTESGITYQNQYFGGDYHNLFWLEINEIYPQRTSLMTTVKPGGVWIWEGAGLTGADAQHDYKDPATVAAANSFWKPLKSVFMEISNFRNGMGDFNAVRTRITQSCDTRDPAWYPHEMEVS